jgi:hypothetical protein
MCWVFRDEYQEEAGRGLQNFFKRLVSVVGWKDLFLHLYKTQMF